MLSSKRRPTTSVKHSSKSKLEPSSVLTHKRMPTPHDLIIRKYYLPVRQEDERHRAFQITRFIAGRPLFTQDSTLLMPWDFPSCKRYTVNRNASPNFISNRRKSYSKQSTITSTARKTLGWLLIDVRFISMGLPFIYCWKITEK
jgi:hypothetical protein